MGPGDVDRVPVVDRQQAELDEAVPGWVCWPTRAWAGYTSWSAMPHGARVAVFMNVDSPAELIKAIGEYVAELPQHIEDTKAELASLPGTGIGRDRAAVLEALLTALEVLGVKDAAAES